MGTGSEERSYNDREFPNGNGETKQYQHRARASDG